FPCERIKYQVQSGSNELKLEGEITTWMSPEAPLTGLVAMENSLIGIKMQMVLSSWGPDRREVLREVPAAKLTKSERSRVSFEAGGETLEFMMLERGAFELADSEGKPIQSL